MGSFIARNASPFDDRLVSPVQYTTDGTPTGLEKAMRWRVNRGRFDTVSGNAGNLTRGIPALLDIPKEPGPGERPRPFDSADGNPQFGGGLFLGQIYKEQELNKLRGAGF
jgi:hypothetical protein